MSTTQKLADIKAKVLKYEQTPCVRAIPLAQHPVLQLIPIIGNIVVFVQASLLIRRINQTVRISFHERLETWVSVYILLIVGMVPVLGLALTIYCTHCSDHLVIALSQLRKQKQEQDKGSSGASSSEDADMEAGASLLVSPLERPATSKSAASTRSKKSLKDVIKRQGSVMSQKSSRQAAAQSEEAEAKPESAVPKPAVVLRQPSVFDRISRMPWMDEVMGTSPTDSYRTSLSTNIAFAPPHTRYADIHDLAMRNSKLPATSSSLLSLPEYLAARRESLFSNDDLVLGCKEKRITRSLLMDDTQLLAMNRLLERPDYSNLGKRVIRRQSSSLVALAPSPQIL
ncbi:hypothetical protein LPJ70_005086 [Coemansia sp. RSA 2708]|nr:hypothetical protein LPJ70_005086 [Coemansia sp. RSA 2708]